MSLAPRLSVQANPCAAQVKRSGRSQKQRLVRKEVA